MTRFTQDLEAKLPLYLEDLARKVADHPEVSAESLALLRVYLGEVKVGFDTISPFLMPNQRVLEVGSGVGALGYFLAENGIDIHGIEPSGTGFGVMDELAKFVRASVANSEVFQSKDKGAEALSLTNDGAFDLVFSIHVLEHLPSADASIKAMNSVLKPGGKMVHLCPNYRFPYDPHFFIPIIFWSPKLTARVFSKRIKVAPDMWEGLNFITADDVKRYALANDLSFELKSGVMADFFKRLLNDPIFSERHNGLLAKLASFIAKTPLIHLVNILPASVASPMIVKLEKPNP